MRVKSRIVTAAAALTLVAGLGAAGTLTANAATPACGQQCNEFFSAALGTFDHPGFILDALNQGQSTGTPVVLRGASGTNPGEDFQVENLGPLSEYYQAGLSPTGLAQLYGCDPGRSFTTCPAGTADDLAAEIEYSPDGAPTGQCIGVGSTPGAFTPIAMEPCGVSERTLWVITGTSSTFPFNFPYELPTSYFELISDATDSSFSHPYSLTTLPVPGTSLHTLYTLPLTTSGGRVISSQQWGEDSGPYPFSAPGP